jgi:hypothetical protein
MSGYNKAAIKEILAALDIGFDEFIPGGGPEGGLGRAVATREVSGIHGPVKVRVSWLIFDKSVQVTAEVDGGSLLLDVYQQSMLDERRLNRIFELAELKINADLKSFED